MLSTVSAVQILATVDALDELDFEGRGGREQVGKCKCECFCVIARLINQILLGCKTARLAPLLVMNGVRPIPDFSTALSMHCHCSA